VVVVQAEGAAQPARIPWTLSVAPDVPKLISGLELSTRFVRPSDRDPTVLRFRAGAVAETAEGVSVEPVALLEVELWTARGKRLGLLARLRDLLPGRYAIGLTGRDPEGRRLPPGRYVVRLRAYGADSSQDSSVATKASVGFRVLASSGPPAP
jgi:hypothetical protein